LKEKLNSLMVTGQARPNWAPAKVGQGSGHCGGFIFKGEVVMALVLQVELVAHEHKHGMHGDHPPQSVISLLRKLQKGANILLWVLGTHCDSTAG